MASREAVRQANHARRKNLLGKTFGRWTVLTAAPSELHGNGRLYAMWTCRCECGKSKRVPSMSLLRGDSLSCGCLGRERRAAAIFKHGHATKKRRSAIYRTWHGMIQRCTDPNISNFHRYGGRGIKVCRRWENSFLSFLEDMGDRPIGTSLDRINNNRGYSKGNCRWATRLVQLNNTSRNKFVRYRGERLTYSQWAKRFALPVTCFWKRLNEMGWPMKKIESTPVRSFVSSY